MTQPLITFALLLISLSIHSQTLERSVISASGDYDQGQGISLEWTVGELAVSSITTDDGMITEGFHQPVLQVEKLESGFDNDIEVTIAPNPVRAWLNIGVDDPEKRMLELELFDVQGKLIDRLEMDTSIENVQMDMTNFASGTYLLRIVNPASGTLVDAFKVSKI